MSGNLTFLMTPVQILEFCASHIYRTLMGLSDAVDCNMEVTHRKGMHGVKCEMIVHGDTVANWWVDYSQIAHVTNGTLLMAECEALAAGIAFDAMDKARESHRKAVEKTEAMSEVIDKLDPGG